MSERVVRIARRPLLRFGPLPASGFLYRAAHGLRLNDWTPIYLRFSGSRHSGQSESDRETPSTHKAHRRIEGTFFFTQRFYGPRVTLLGFYGAAVRRRYETALRLTNRK
ncbi:hypothetical protein SPMU_23740 [Sphingomonas mucosissima]|uniref:Uncharacterized protein n=1 Tax=Sphingomonas mucosissima TaxID=370959 RepID=A0A245ZJM0_9SPHN|nr:hypothetical protein SPMU_23740 [Sphingomonas mucosissima]